jgi:DNA-binding transcriptional ArsR family regulator
MNMGPLIAEIAGLVGEPARAAMLSALLDGRALTAGELAYAARVSPKPPARIWRSSLRLDC